MAMSGGLVRCQFLEMPQKSSYANLINPNALRSVYKRKEVSIMNNYINYTFYDDDQRLIAIVYPNTPIEVIHDLLQKYDEVKFKE